MSHTTTCNGRGQQTIPVPGAIVAAMVLAAVQVAAVAQSETAGDTWEQAQQLFSARNYSECIRLLERPGPAAATSARKLTLLCAAYRELIKQALRDGDQARVAQLVERLRQHERVLLRLESRRLGMSSASENARSSAPGRPPTSDDANRPAEQFTRDRGGWRPRRQPPARKPAARDRQVTAVADARPVQQPTPPTTSGQPVQLLHQANAAFARKDYATASKLYRTIHRKGPQYLSSAALRRWAYCRLTEVVNLVNRGPRSEAEWRAAEAELNDVLNLLLQRGSQEPEKDPLVRYTRFLLGVVKERQGPQRKSPEMIRAAEPESSSNRPRLLERFRRPYPPATVDLTSPRHRAQAGGAALHRLRTRNFVVLGMDPYALQHVAPVLEKARQDVAARLPLPGLQITPWDPPCVVRFHVAATGPAPAVSTIQLDAGRVTARVIDVYPDAADNLEAVLRHELAHVWISSTYRPAPAPAWLDEGLAILVEPPDRFAAHLRNLRRYENAGLVTAGALLGKDRQLPQAVHYAASASLCRFLLERYGGDGLLRFAHAAQQVGPDRAAHEVLGLDGIVGLERAWQSARAAQYVYVGLR